MIVNGAIIVNVIYISLNYNFANFFSININE